MNNRENVMKTVLSAARLENFGSVSAGMYFCMT